MAVVLLHVCVCACVHVCVRVGRGRGQGSVKLGTRHENSAGTYKHGHHNMPVFTLQLALILLGPPPAAILLHVVRLRGILVLSSAMAVELLKSLTVWE